MAAGYHVNEVESPKVVGEIVDVSARLVTRASLLSIGRRPRFGAGVSGAPCACAAARPADAVLRTQSRQRLLLSSSSSS